MTTITATVARRQLEELVADVNNSHEPIRIASMRGISVLVAEDDWRTVHETLCLLSASGMSESIREGMATPVEECDENLGW